MKIKITTTEQKKGYEEKTIYNCNNPTNAVIKIIQFTYNLEMKH